MAPEQVRGDAHLLDGRADTWALGVILYELLTGSRPFRGDSPKELRNAILETEPKPPRDVDRSIPRDLQRVCLKCLEKEPADRYETAADLSRDLAQIQQHPRLLPRTRGGRVMAGIVAALLVSLIAFGLWQLMRERPFTPPQQEDIPLSPWLADCKLVLTAQTGATIDLDAAEKAVTDAPTSTLGTHFVTVDATAVKALMEYRREEDWFCFEFPLAFYWPKGDECAALGSETCSLRVRAAVSKDGVFQIGTVSDNLEEHLLVLTIAGGLDNYHRFGGGKVPMDMIGEPRSHRSDLNQRQCLIADWLRELYVYLEKNDAISHGPAHNYDLYRCPIELKNRLPRPITVVQAYLHHVQMEYRGYTPSDRLIDERLNAIWSPIAEDSERKEKTHLEFSFDMESTQDMLSAICCRAYTDNDNASSFKIYGLTLNDADCKPHNGTYASIAVDPTQGTCEGQNPIVDGKVVVGTADAILFGQAPTRVELTVDTTWSVSSPRFRYATLGDVKILGSDWSPKGQAKREIRPQVWIIPSDCKQP